MEIDKKKYLQNLLKQAEKTNTTEHHGSETAAWKAYREIEKLDDSSLIDILKQWLETEKSTKTRTTIYYIIACIAENLEDASIIEFLLKKLETEDDGLIIHTILTKIYTAQVPFFQHSNIILDHLTDERSLVRHSAIRVLYLAKSNKSSVEDALLEVLDYPYDEYDIYYAASSLAHVGSSKSIPYLERALKEVENHEFKSIIQKTIRKLSNEPRQ